MRRMPVIAAVLIFIVGALVRLTVDSGFKGAGFDESLYRNYILLIDELGLAKYPRLCEAYVEDLRDPSTIAKLPPTRFLYIFCGWVGKRAFFGSTPPRDISVDEEAEHDPALMALHGVSLIFSILMVGLCGVTAWRMTDYRVGLGVMALAATSPLAIHMAKHALVDGFLAFWATLCLWLLWENLKKPNDVRWLVAFAAALALLVMTKENSFFVYVALAAIVVANRWAKFGIVTNKLLCMGILGPLTGVSVLVILAGGLDTFIDIYRLLVLRAGQLAYAQETGGGPWYRYLIELIIIDPIVFVLAATGLFTLPSKSRAFGYLLAFVVFSYAIMCNVRNGMNLRYTTIWMLPLAAMAMAQIVEFAQARGRGGWLAAVAVIVGICAFNLGQYHTFFADTPIYEPVPADTLQAVNILK